jgi:hypothetical protein
MNSAASVVIIAMCALIGINFIGRAAAARYW